MKMLGWMKEARPMRQHNPIILSEEQWRGWSDERGASDGSMGSRDDGGAGKDAMGSGDGTRGSVEGGGKVAGADGVGGARMVLSKEGGLDSISRSIIGANLMQGGSNGVG